MDENNKVTQEKQLFIVKNKTKEASMESSRASSDLRYPSFSQDEAFLSQDPKI